MHSFAAGLLFVYKLCFCVMFTLNWACAKSVLGTCRHNWPCLWQIWWMTMTIWYVFGWLKLRLNSGFVLKLRHRLDAVTHLATTAHFTGIFLFFCFWVGTFAMNLNHSSSTFSYLILIFLFLICILDVEVAVSLLEHVFLHSRAIKQK